MTLGILDVLKKNGLIPHLSESNLVM